MCFFFQRARAQEFLHVLLVGQGAFALRAKLPLVLFFGRFHATNGNVSAQRAGEAALEARPYRVAELRDRLSHVAQLLLPTRGVPFFRLGHPQQNGFSLLVLFALGQITINPRRLRFGAPIALDHFNRFPAAFGIVGWVVHLAQSIDSMTAVTGCAIFR